jgi:hypothetical protein
MVVLLHLTRFSENAAAANQEPEKRGKDYHQVFTAYNDA